MKAKSMHTIKLLLICSNILIVIYAVWIYLFYSWGNTRNWFGYTNDIFLTFVIAVVSLIIVMINFAVVSELNSEEIKAKK